MREENFTQTPEPLISNSADEATIRNLFQQLIDSWNRGNGNAYAAVFIEEADYVAFNGDHSKGREAIARQHQQLFDTFLKGTRLRGEVKSLQFLSPNIALVHAIGGTLMSWQSDTAKPGRKSIQTLVATKHEGEWRFASFHNTRIQPLGIGTIASGVTNLLWQRLFCRSK
ncbi:SgcJ/EcaC family oxidoreductase [Pleurocapsales cyanobacterium LEGE 06147]|nr:SgcJ/EcaC family oxidoreductase [Pleurocapsales cyanobacterium LEGE 06147]